jgi:hypothetical protein
LILAELCLKPHADFSDFNIMTPGGAEDQQQAAVDTLMQFIMDKTRQCTHADYFKFFEHFEMKCIGIVNP